MTGFWHRWRLLPVCAWLALASLPAGAVEVQRVISPGGIEAWLVEEHSIPIVSLRFAFRGGTSLDPTGKEGLATMVSVLLDEGAGDMDALAFQTALEESAIRLRFEAGLDEFGGTLETLTERRARAVELLAVALTAPRFADEAVERMRQQQLTRLARDAKDPDTLARTLWYRLAFPDHPYGRPVPGTIEGVKAIAPDDLKAFTARRFTRDQLLVGVAGDIAAEELGRLLDASFGQLPALGEAITVAEVKPAKAGALIIEPLDQPQSVVVFGGPGVKREDPDYYAAYVLNYILGGGGFGSRLTEEVREKRGLAYGVYSYLAPFDHAGLFLGGVATENGRVAESLAVIDAELVRMRDAGVTETELTNAKTYLTGSFALRLDSNAEIADILVGMQIGKLGIDYLDRRNSLIEAVTIADIARVAKTLVDPTNLATVVVGAPENLAARDGN